MKRSISIVMAYYSRLKQLMFTLKTINLSEYRSDIEVIIVDDASEEDERAGLIFSSQDRWMWKDLKIKLLTISQEHRWWKNPCIPFNMGFSKADGKIVLIQNPECIHIGDIVKFAVDNVTNANYITFSVAALYDMNMVGDLYGLEVNEFFFERVCQIVKPESITNQVTDYVNHWYNHPVHRPLHFHFVSAITRRNLRSLGGFDEEYSHGTGWDDAGFVIRIQRKGLKIISIPPDKVFSIHLPHDEVTKIRRREITPSTLYTNERVFEHRIMGNQLWKVRNSFW